MKQSRCFLAHESPFPVGGGFFGGVISILLPNFWNLKDGSIKMGNYPDLNYFEAFLFLWVISFWGDFFNGEYLSKTLFFTRAVLVCSKLIWDVLEFLPVSHQFRWGTVSLTGRFLSYFRISFGLLKNTSTGFLTGQYLVTLLISSSFHQTWQ